MQTLLAAALELDCPSHTNHQSPGCTRRFLPTLPAISSNNSQTRQSSFSTCHTTRRECTTLSARRLSDGTARVSSAGWHSARRHIFFCMVSITGVSHWCYSPICRRRTRQGRARVWSSASCSVEASLPLRKKIKK